MNAGEFRSMDYIIARNANGLEFRPVRESTLLKRAGMHTVIKLASKVLINMSMIRILINAFIQP